MNRRGFPQTCCVREDLAAARDKIKEMLKLK